MRLGPRAPDADGIAEAAKQQGVPLAQLDLPDDAVRDLYAADLVLVRPDQVVAWRGDSLPTDPVALWRTLTGFRSRVRR